MIGKKRQFGQCFQFAKRQRVIGQIDKDFRPQDAQLDVRGTNEDQPFNGGKRGGKVAFSQPFRNELLVERRVVGIGQQIKPGYLGADR
ncbi:MAG: hypothetical protein VXY86_07915 [Pseudomonadota bacterium]|nr:hypothetical protein [Pseudomonadota bacterium]